MIDDPDLIEAAPGILVLPVVPGRLEGRNTVARVLAQYAFATVAVEYPAPLLDHVAKWISDAPEVFHLAWTSPRDHETLWAAFDQLDGRYEAARLALDAKTELHFIDDTDAARGETATADPDAEALRRIGMNAAVQALRSAREPFEPTPRERRLARRLQDLTQRDRHLLAVVRFQSAAGVVKALGGVLDDVDTSVDQPPIVRLFEYQDLWSFRPAQAEIHGLHRAYRQQRDRLRPGESFDRFRYLAETLLEAAKEYTEEFDERISRTQWQALTQYARNLALLQDRFVPGMRELITAAQGCVDDDFAAILLEYLGLESIRRRDETPRSVPSHLTQDDIDKDNAQAIPAYPEPPTSLVEYKFHLRRRAPVEERLQWQKEFDEDFNLGMCSWPPEDERIEKFFAFLRNRALQHLADEHTHVHEFTSSMQDGIDIRETMRNWHRGKLYVRHERRPVGRVGPVVLVWHDFPLDAEGLWRTTLYAEHQNESDLALYGAPLGKHMVGPRITRSEYHGVLSLYPAIHPPDLWQLVGQIPVFTCAQHLLACAILLSEERYVAWIAAEPPDPGLNKLARVNGIRIIHLPLGTFSRQTLRRLRKVHILGTKLARQWANDYIDD